MRDRLKEWAHESPLMRARVYERSRKHYVLIGLWPLSWGLGLLIDAEDGFQLQLGPVGVQIF